MHMDKYDIKSEQGQFGGGEAQLGEEQGSATGVCVVNSHKVQ